MSELPSVFTFSRDISQEEAPPPLPARSYTATITGAVAKLSSKGNTYADITFSISPEQFPPDFAAVQKDAVNLHYRRLTMGDTQRERYAIKKFCQNVRYPITREFDLNGLIGKMATIKVVETEYDGEKRADIKSVEPA